MPKFACANSGRAITLSIRAVSESSCAQVLSEGTTSTRRQAMADRNTRLRTASSLWESRGGSVDVRAAPRTAQLLKRNVQNRILAPVFVVKMPPLVFVD